MHLRLYNFTLYKMFSKKKIHSISIYSLLTGSSQFLGLDWPHPTQRWRQHSMHGDGVESAWWFRKSSRLTVSDLEKSSRARDEKAWEKLARAEITSQKPHTMASRYSWCPMSYRGLRTRRSSQFQIRFNCHQVMWFRLMFLPNDHSLLQNPTDAIVPLHALEEVLYFP